MKSPEKAPAFAGIPKNLEPVGRKSPQLSTLFGDLGKEELSLLQELKSREADIEAWIAADTARAAQLQEDPKAAIADLLKHLRLDDRELASRANRVPAGWKLDVLQVRGTPVGSKLLAAVWTHLNAAQQNVADFRTDPIAVVNSVAGATAATAAERQAVVDALSTVLGIATVRIDAAVEWIRNKTIAETWTRERTGVFLHRE